MLKDLSEHLGLSLTQRDLKEVDYEAQQSHGRIILNFCLTAQVSEIIQFHTVSSFCWTLVISYNSAIFLSISVLIDTRNLFHLKSLDKGQHSEFTFEKENAKKSLLERINAMKHAAMPSRSWSVFSWSIVSTPSSQQKLVGGIRLATAGFPSPSKRLIPFWRFGSESVQWPYNAYYPRYRKFHFQDHSDYLVFLLTWASNFDFDSVECFVTIVSKYESSYFCFEGFWKLTFLWTARLFQTVGNSRYDWSHDFMQSPRSWWPCRSLNLVETWQFRQFGQFRYQAVNIEMSLQALEAEATRQPSYGPFMDGVVGGLSPSNLEFSKGLGAEAVHFSGFEHVRNADQIGHAADLLGTRTEHRSCPV